MSLLALGRNGINLIDEDDGGGILFCLLKCLSQVALALPRQLGHYLGAVYEEEERARLVGHGARYQRLACDQILMKFNLI